MENTVKSLKLKLNGLTLAHPLACSWRTFVDGHKTGKMAIFEFPTSPERRVALTAFVEYGP